MVEFDLAKHPGFLFVLATLLPLASFVFLLLLGGLRWAFRSSGEGTTGEACYRMLGGDEPQRWPAFVATGAIALACACSITGFILYAGEAPQIEHLEGEVADLEAQHHHVKEHMKAGPERDKKLKELEGELAAKRPELQRLQWHWEDKFTWLKLGINRKDPQPATNLELGYKIDYLNAIMFVMVTFIATLIHIFSMGYMSDELTKKYEDHQVHTEDGHWHRKGRYGRFFLYLSLFCFSMLNLILADNLFQVFLSWELVGICSYLLIGFYFERQSASNASNKAFITNRIGDAGFIIGLLILWTHVGTFNFDGVFARVRAPLADAHNVKLDYGGKFVRGNVIEKDGNDETIEIDPNGNQVVVFAPNMHLHASEIAAPKPKEDNPDEIEKSLLFTVSTPSNDEPSSMPYWMLVVAGLGIFLGCIGKSAQFPLQVWLPDAMEGPTPVSALIHAATMVAAGVYLVGRCFPLFTPEVLLVIAYVGAITLFVAATIAVVATDIKKVLAYSTVSQLGYMMLALGIGGWVAGLFHLLTHAFFKALLFLGSGSVIHGCHHEQDMRKMGGLYAKMKVTALTMLMGVLAISGVPGFSGWYSKDAILASSMGFAYVNPQHMLLFVLPLITAGITTFYMFRMWLMTFAGKPKDHHVYDHAHESPKVMTGPLVALAICSVVIAWGWPFFSSHFPFINAESSWLEHQLHHAQPDSVGADFGRLASEGGAIGAAESNARYQALQLHHTAGNLALLMVAIGLAFALMLYYYQVLDPEEAKAQFPGVHRFLSNKWHFDELYSVFLVRPAMAVAKWCSTADKKGIDVAVDSSAKATIWVSRKSGETDRGVVDGLVNLIATVAYAIAGWFRGFQTGYIRSYILFLALSAVGIFAILTWFARPG